MRVLKFKINNEISVDPIEVIKFATAAPVPPKYGIKSMLKPIVEKIDRIDIINKYFKRPSI